MHHPAAVLSAGSVTVHPKYILLSPCETTIEATFHGVPDVVAGVDGDDQDQALAFVDPRADPAAAGPDPHAGAILALLGGWPTSAAAEQDVDLAGSGKNTLLGLA